jgi:hypothetical protein
MSTHEVEKKELEENFEKLRLSLQVSIVLIFLTGVKVTAVFPLTSIYIAPTVYWTLN